MGAPLLTFDDGPSESTGEILDLLRSYGIPATFFVIGFRGEQRPDLVKRANDEGHVIGNHTWDHVGLADILSDAEGDGDLERRIEVVKLKLQQANDAIATIIGAPPTLFRGPWLNVDDRVLRIAETLGLSHIRVDVDTCDYDERYDADDVASAILGAGADQIVLLHAEPAMSEGEPSIPHALRQSRRCGERCLSSPNVGKSQPDYGECSGHRTLPRGASWTGLEESGGERHAPPLVAKE